MAILNKLLLLPRWAKRVVQVVLDIITISACYVIAMWLRLDSWAFARDLDTWLVLLPVLPVSLLVFARLGLYRAILRYIGNQIIKTVAIGILSSAAVMLVASQTFDWFVPRSVPIIYALLAIIAIGGTRLFWRALYAQYHAPRREAVAVFGAGDSGRQVVASLRNGSEYVPVIFLDDAPALKGAIISGLRVYSPKDLGVVLERYSITTVLLAVPRLKRSDRQAIIELLEPWPVRVQTIPEMSDLVAGRAGWDEVQPVKIEDLLGRNPVPPQPELMAATIAGKTVLVTGAGGSIGSELCRQILTQNPKKLVLFEQSEFNLYRIEQELRGALDAEGSLVELHPMLGSVQNEHQVLSALRTFQVQTVYHAAAYKHVPLVEANVVEAIQNNVFGTLNVAKSSVVANVEAFILISTDKAVRPTNVMGASKRLAELICQALATHTDLPRFSIVRFGNVLGSSGSVIPLFLEQIENGGPVTVTSPNITRYFMTIPEAAQLVVQAGAMAEGGEVFVLDMGEPVEIVELAKRMIRLSGRTPWIDGKDAPGDIEIRFTGLRAGEKMFEELLISENSMSTQHDQIRAARERVLDQDALDQILDALRAAKDSETNIREVLANAPLDFRPSRL